TDFVVVKIVLSFHFVVLEPRWLRPLSRSDCTRRPLSGLCSLTDLEAVLGAEALLFPVLCDTANLRDTLRYRVDGKWWSSDRSSTRQHLFTFRPGLRSTWR